MGCGFCPSGCAIVLVDDTAEDAFAPDDGVEVDDDGGVVFWRSLASALMGTMPIEMPEGLWVPKTTSALVVEASGQNENRASRPTALAQAMHWRVPAHVAGSTRARPVRRAP